MSLSLLWTIRLSGLNPMFGSFRCQTKTPSKGQLKLMSLSLLRTVCLGVLNPMFCFIPLSDQDPKQKQVDGLSVERLTLLGRVHVARVNVLQLSLHGHDLTLRPAVKRPVGQPDVLAGPHDL